jgi:hypothetical protein
MNRVSLWIILVALGLTAGCGSSNNNNIQVNFSQPPPGILAPGAPPVSVTATVTGDSAHAGVAWSCTPGNTAATCGSFTPSTTPSGTATMYSAPATAVGSVVITATSVTNTAAFMNADVQISTSGGLSGNYSFYLSGIDANNVYSLAGAVNIAANGTLTGEEDYNDAGGITASDVPISSGSLSFNPTTGLGTLILVTNNNNLGEHGTETLALNFVNNNHALIIQADGSATSSGSFDLQTLPSTPAGGFSFVLSGAGNNGDTIFFGGVFTVSGTSVTDGMFDKNDDGNVTPTPSTPPASGTSFTGKLSSPIADSFGRGTLTGTGIANTIAYYIVGPEAIRLIDVDSSNTLVGSAFGQGASAGNFTTSSIGNSVFSIQSNFATGAVPYGAVGQIVPLGGSFSNGVADLNVAGVTSVDGQTISGNYAIDSNGRGSLTIASVLGDVNVAAVENLGIYLVDPTLNLNDPNNTTTPGAGSTVSAALVVDLDTDVAGSGVLVQQTDTALASFAGNYALGLQDLLPNEGVEFDFAGNATATAATATTPGSLSGTGVVSDPGELLTGQPVDTGTSFTITSAPDPANPGRYLLDPFTLAVGSGVNYEAIVYQASGGQLFWLEGADDEFNTQTGGSVFSGQIQQQTLPLGAAAKKAAAKQTQKQ